MSWWKIAKIDDDEDRTRVNDGIHTLETFSEYLNYASDLIYMTARGARSLVSQIRNNKAMSSYPDLQDKLLEADDVALDSPKRFAAICKDVVNCIGDIISELEDQRNKYVEVTAPKKFKGFIENE